MLLNDKPNCQVSRILMNPRPIFSYGSQNERQIWSSLQRKKEIIRESIK
jgi:hypothetical protein